MTGLDDILLEEVDRVRTVEVLTESNDDIDAFIDDSDIDESSKEICPQCGKSIVDCECEEEDDDYDIHDPLNYYDIEDIEDDIEEIDNELNFDLEESVLSRYEKLQTLHEVYFGKTKDLLEAEQILHKIRYKYMGSKYNANINSDPLLVEFGDKLAKVFGLYTFALEVTPGRQKNAFTIPLSYAVDTTNTSLKLVKDKNSFKYNESAKYSLGVFVAQGLMFDESFSDGEILAIILHEVGHNFSASIDNSIMTFANIVPIITMYNLFISVLTGRIDQNTLIDTAAIAPNDVRNLMTDVTKAIRKSKGFSFMFDAMSSVFAAAGDLLTEISSLISYITGNALLIPAVIINALAGWWINIFIAPIKYRDEKIADAFATAYGYGPEITSALRKMTERPGIDSVEALREIPYIGTFFETLNLPFNIILYLFDEHPETIERIKSANRQLEKELSSKDLNPKMRKVLESDFKKIKKVEEEALDTSKGCKDPMLVKKLYWNWLCNNFNGDYKHKSYDMGYLDKIDRTYKAVNNNY